ncbi:MAG: S46 family peptidase [Planctomycetota bacterium]|nr:MAG: S46 family peptidase [Planctomycetota bacterium]
MRRLARLFRPPLRVLLPLLALAGGTWLAADEGQWLPEQIRGFDWPALRARGLELTADEIWNGEEGLLSAAVNLNGCSASFISPRGLVVTNHHCGYGAINAHSTPENNLLEQGFLAADPSEELPARGMRVSIVRGFDDVTAEMQEAMAEAGDDPAARARAVERRRRELEDEVRAPGADAVVVPFFEGRIWRRIRRTVFEDVRLVCAPPAAIGEYGGEEDNWMWPRHTGDFCFFRVYVAPDGTPAPYAEENVPYHPERWLEVSEEGVEEGDLVLILGYPGRTERYLSSVAVAMRESWYYPMRERLFRAMIAGIEAETAADPAASLRARSRIKGLANGLKNAQGMIAGLARNRVVERKEAEEAEFRRWAQNDNRRARVYGRVLDELLELDRRELARQERDFLFEALVRYSGLARMGRAVAAELAGGEPAEPVLRRERGRLWAGSEEAVLALVFEELWRLPEPQRGPWWDLLFAGVGSRAEAAAAGRARARSTALAAAAAWQEVTDPAADPMVELMVLLRPVLAELAEFRAAQAGERLRVGPRWIAAQEEWRGERFYPDANGTLRVSVATVKGYQPRDGVWYPPRTTVAGIVEKHTGRPPFDAPDELLAAAARPGRGEIPVCFLSDGDTTGGNSGSPVVDGRGRLVGLNFDRVFENVAGDYGWNPERSRNISVDIRYVLWLLREVYPAPRLVAEMLGPDRRGG